MNVVPLLDPGLFLGQPCRVWCESGEGEKYFHYWRCLLLHHAWELPFGKTNWIGGCCQFSWSSGWEVPWLLHVCVQQVTFFCGGHVDSCVPVPSQTYIQTFRTYIPTRYIKYQGTISSNLMWYMIMFVSYCALPVIQIQNLNWYVIWYV